MELIVNVISELARVNRKITEVEMGIVKTSCNLAQVNALIQSENIITRCMSQLTDLDVVPVETVDELKDENDVLKQLILGEWVDCEAVQKALGIDFATGTRMFEFTRMGDGNIRPLNGKRAVTKCRLKVMADG